MERSGIKNLQSGTPSFTQLKPTAAEPFFNPFPSQYQFYSEQRYLAATSPSYYPANHHAAAPANFIWQTATPPLPLTVPAAAATNNAYTEPLQHLHTKHKQSKPSWHTTPSKSKSKLKPTLSNKSRRLVQ
jgi:hypothetical protein